MTDEAAIDARVEKVMARRRTSDAKSQAKRRSGLAGLEAENARLRDQVARLQAELAACRGTEA
jgi:molecular chaperone GrpE (heat shock protein)